MRVFLNVLLWTSKYVDLCAPKYGKERYYKLCETYTALQSIQYFCIHNVEHMKLQTEVCLLAENIFHIESSTINSTIFNQWCVQLLSTKHFVWMTCRSYMILNFLNSRNTKWINKNSVCQHNTNTLFTTVNGCPKN
jgi:hypothetical protein